MTRLPGDGPPIPPADFDLTAVDPPLRIADPEDIGAEPTRLSPLGPPTIPELRPPRPRLPSAMATRPARPYAPLPSLGTLSTDTDFGPEMTNVAQMVSENPIIADRYAIEEPIGEGGMGRVFRVTHRTLGKRFALKLMRTAFSGQDTARERFYQEARLASSLAHPNIVSVIDFGEDPNLGAYMVMELLEGEPLADRLTVEGRLGLRMACEVILEIAEALHYIHERQIVHCDIKVDNILLCPVQGTERRRMQVKLLDFGIARMRSGTNATPIGDAITVDGTPEYVSPERLRGAAPTHSMDIYSLGILSYQLMTGRLPFSGNLAAVIDAHLHHPPPPMAQKLVPLTGSASGSTSAIDERAEQMVMKALAKNPADRQRDMTAFLYELRTLMDMLGFGRGRRRAPQAQVVRAAASQAKQQAEAREDRLGRSAFERAPLPMAGVSAEGVVVVANPAFARFLTGKTDESVEGTDLLQSMLSTHDRELGPELQRVHDSDDPVQHVLALRRADGIVIRLLLLLFPAHEEAYDVHVTIHPLDPPM